MKKHFFIMAMLCLYLSNYISAQEIWTKTSLTDKYPVNCMATIGNDIYVGLGGGGLYKSIDDGNTWTEINNGIGPKLIVAITTNGNKIYVSSYTEGIYVSTDKGESWRILKNVPNQYVYSLAISGPHLIIGTWEGIYYTKDEETWSRSIITGEKKHSLATSLFESKKGVLAGSGQFIFFSDDNGKTFTSHPAATSFDIGTFTESNGTIIAGTTGEGLISSSDGKNWAKKTNIKSENELSNVNVVLGDSTDLLIASSDKGVISNGDKLINGKSDLAVKSFIVHKKIYFAGTHKQGLWRLALKSNLNQLESESRSAFHITAQVFPNPMSSNSILSYGINQKADVRIEIVYPNGVVYSAIKMTAQNPGNYQIKLSDYNLGSGVYYLIIKAKDKVEMKKMVILY